MSQSTRFLFHTSNRRGLGHLVRGQNIAIQLRWLAPEAEISFFTRGAPPQPMLVPGVRYVAESEGGAGDGWTGLLEDFAPHVVIYDTMIPDEARIATLSPGMRKAFVMRKCQDDRQQQVLAHPRLGDFDLVLVPHTPDEFGHAVPAAIADRTHFVGPITRLPDPSRYEDLRRRYALQDADFVLVSTPGGGGFQDEAQRFFDVVCEAHRAVRAELPGLRHVVIQGPKFEGHMEALDGMVVIPAEPDLVSLLSLADLVVSAGGYNTVNEIRVGQAPAVFLPSPRTHDDQQQRVQALADAGLACAAPQDGSPADLAAVIAACCLDPAWLGAVRRNYLADRVELGNERAARHLLALAGG